VRAEPKVISRHLTKAGAHAKCSELRMKQPRAGRSSGNTKVDFSVRGRSGLHLKRHEVVSR